MLSFSQDYYPYSNAIHLNIGSHLSISKGEYESFTGVENNVNLFLNAAIGYSFNITEFFNLEAEIDFSPLSMVQTTGGGIDDHQFEASYGIDLNGALIMTENFMLLAGLRYAEGELTLDDEKGFISVASVPTSYTALQFGFRYVINNNFYYTIKFALPEMEESYKGLKINSKDVHIKLNGTFFIE